MLQQLSEEGDTARECICVLLFHAICMGWEYPKRAKAMLTH